MPREDFIVTDADVLRSWDQQTQGHPDNCGCGACAFDPRCLEIPPFADCPGDSPSFVETVNLPDSNFDREVRPLLVVPTVTVESVRNFRAASAKRGRWIEEIHLSKRVFGTLIADLKRLGKINKEEKTDEWHMFYLFGIRIFDDCEITEFWFKHRYLRREE